MYRCNLCAVKGLTLGAAAACALALLTAACGGKAEPPAAAAAAKGCPASWKPGWQRLADEIKAPIYCPAWVPAPLTAKIGGEYTDIRSVDRRDRSYLISFVWKESESGLAGGEVHVNFRGYPGRTAVPTCIAVNTVNGVTRRTRIPCFSDSRGRKRVGGMEVTVYTVNQDADQWHVLYAWHHDGSLYAVSEHVAPPYSFRRVVANLDRMVRGLVLIEATR